MLTNYFILYRIVKELDAALKGFRILSAFTQEKERAILECRKGEETSFIEISVSQNSPWITLRQRYTRAKKNVFNLFKDFFPAEITRVSIAEYERVIKIETTSGALFFTIRGNKTNLYAVSKENAESFLRTDPSEIQKSGAQFYSLEYSDEFPGLPFSKDSLEENDILHSYPYLGKDILTEAKVRNTDNLKDGIISTIQDVLINPPAIYSDNNSIKLAVQGFQIFNGWNMDLMPDFITAVNSFISKRFSGEYFQQQKKSLLSVYENELGKIASRINNLRGRIEAGSKEKEYKKTGELLLINLNNIERGKPEILVEDIYNNNETLKIKIDPSLPPRRNVDRYFEKSRDEKVGYEKSIQLYDSYTRKYDDLKKKITEIKNAEASEDIKHMQNKKETKDEKDDIKSKFRQYLIDGKYNLYIGRDSEKNDLLTMKFAKQNDYWFHARGVPGSHAVLRVDNSKEPVPRPVLKKAAAIAAFHSKAKTASIVPVSYTLKKYVTKKKGMEPGKVYLLREEVLLVKPEIPAGVEYISSE